MLPLSRQSFKTSRPSLNACILPSKLNGLSSRNVQRRYISITDLDTQRNGRERVVILGSGWAGYTLSRELNHKKYQVVVVSPRSYFVFTPLLASTSVGTLEFRNALEPVRHHSSPTQFFQGWAERINFESRTLSVEDAVQDPYQGQALTSDRREAKIEPQVDSEVQLAKTKGDLFEMTWDKLVIAVGCYSQTFNTPGVKENAYFLKDVGDARKIRNRMLACFEIASLPTTTTEMKKALLHFAIVGGGPTGIEFAAELHDIITQDLARLYPDLTQYPKITIYDVAPNVLSMFDDKLAEYATKTFQRQRIEILTSHHIEELRVGAPESTRQGDDVKGDTTCYTLKITEEGEVPVGMCIWSTGLMMNPLIQNGLSESVRLPQDNISVIEGSREAHEWWQVKKHPKNGGIITDDRLRVMLEAKDGDKGKASLDSVFAIGDCAVMEDAMYPATAQVASQKAIWLGRRLNKMDLDKTGFTYKDLGIMAYLGNWNAIAQTAGGDISGRAAWLIWRGAYLAKCVSWRNRILIMTYWTVNWLFGRDISRF